MSNPGSGTGRVAMLVLASIALWAVSGGVWADRNGENTASATMQIRLVKRAPLRLFFDDVTPDANATTRHIESLLAATDRRTPTPRIFRILVPERAPDTTADDVQRLIIRSE